MPVPVVQARRYRGKTLARVKSDTKTFLFKLDNMLIDVASGKCAKWN